MKTVRFTRVVKRSGRPHVHTLWVAPDEDPELRRARAAHRVMTVRKSDTGKSDAGIVGFEPARDGSGQFLVFPKSLQPFAGSRVVGLKFDLVDQPKTIAAPSATKNPGRAHARPGRS